MSQTVAASPLRCWTLTTRVTETGHAPVPSGEDGTGVVVIGLGCVGRDEWLRSDAGLRSTSALLAGMVSATGNERISHRRFGPLEYPDSVDEGERPTKVGADQQQRPGDDAESQS